MITFLIKILGSVSRDMGRQHPNLDLSVLSPSEPLLSAFLNSRRTDYAPVRHSVNENLRSSTRMKLRRVST